MVCDAVDQMAKSYSRAQKTLHVQPALERTQMMMMCICVYVCEHVCICVYKHVCIHVCSG